MRIYIAGPYTNGNLIANIRRAVEAGEDVIRKGHAPYIPHLTALWDFIHPHSDVKFWYEYDFHWLRCCEGLLRIPGESKGADAEVQLAKDLLIPVYFDIREIPNEHKKKSQK